MKFQVSRAMPQKNPKVQGGSGFGFFQVFAHSNTHVCAKSVAYLLVFREYSCLNLVLNYCCQMIDCQKTALLS